MSKKPVLTLDAPVTVRRSYEIDQVAATTLERYAEFLSERARKEAGSEAGPAKKRGKEPKVQFTPGQVIAKLTERLAKDSLFQEWNKTRQSGV